MRMQDRIQTKLEEHLAPCDVTVENQSHLHAGHAGDDGSGETHFKVAVVSDHFASLSRVERYRLVHKLLESELSEGVHALTLSLRTKKEQK